MMLTLWRLKGLAICVVGERVSLTVLGFAWQVEGPASRVTWKTLSILLRIAETNRVVMYHTKMYTFIIEMGDPVGV